MNGILTKETLLSKCKVDSLDLIKCISMWGNELQDVSVLGFCKNLTLATLSVNNISSLKHFKDCGKLEELYLRRNNISEIEEISFLKNCKNLKVLWLEENPIQKFVNYRSSIINSLPSLVKLDNIIITEEEREKVNILKWSFKNRRSSINLSTLHEELFTGNNNLLEVNSTDSELKSTACTTQKSVKTVLKRTSKHSVNTTAITNEQTNNIVLPNKTTPNFNKSPKPTVCSINLNLNNNVNFMSANKFYKQKVRSPCKKNFRSCEKDLKEFNIDANKNNSVIFAIENLLDTLSKTQLQYVQTLINGKISN